MALLSAFVLWDVSFQLSFMATLGLVLYADPLMQWITRLVALRLPAESAQKLARPLGEYLLFTLAALVTTLPVIAYHFQRLSLSALVANPLILPAQPAVMVLGGLAVALGLISQPLGQAVAYLAWPFVAYTIRAVEWLAQLPGGVFLTGQISLGWVFLFYGVLFLATFAGRRRSSLVGLVKPSLVLAALGALAVVVWQAAFSAPDGRLHLAALEVGGGEALLITTPGGRSILINGGSSPSRLSDGLGRRLPLTRRRLDYLVVASPESEQISALPRILERFPPRQVLWAGSGEESSVVRSLRNFFSERGIAPMSAQSGQVLDLGDGAMLRVLQAGESGAVLLLEWGSFRALLPLGMDEAALAELLDDPTLTAVAALLLADGGSVALNPQEWIEKLNPQVVLLSPAPGGEPDAEVIQALDGYNLLRTDRNGWIEITTDGDQLWVEVERR
jgi:competence protein ComEC